MSAQYDRQQYNDHHSDQPELRMPSVGGTIAKIAIGAFIIIVGSDEIGKDLEQFLIFLVLGLAFIAWGVIPAVLYMKRKKAADAERMERILNAPFPGSAPKDDAELLAEKYYNK